MQLELSEPTTYFSFPNSPQHTEPSDSHQEIHLAQAALSPVSEYEQPLHLLLCGLSESYHAWVGHALGTRLRGFREENAKVHMS